MSSVTSPAPASLRTREVSPASALRFVTPPEPGDLPEPALPPPPSLTHKVFRCPFLVRTQPTRERRDARPSARYQLGV